MKLVPYGHNYMIMTVLDCILGSNRGTFHDLAAFKTVQHNYGTHYACIFAGPYNKAGKSKINYAHY